MKKMLVCRLGMGLAASLAIVMALNAEEKNQVPSDPAALEQRVATLEKENKDLKEQLKKLEIELKFRSVFQVPAKLTQPLVLPPSATESVPKDWRPRQFNGMTVYTVPLNK